MNIRVIEINLNNDVTSEINIPVGETWTERLVAAFGRREIASQIRPGQPHEGCWEGDYTFVQQSRDLCQVAARAADPVTFDRWAARGLLTHGTIWPRFGPANDAAISEVARQATCLGVDPETADTTRQWSWSVGLNELLAGLADHCEADTLFGPNALKVPSARWTHRYEIMPDEPVGQWQIHCAACGRYVGRDGVRWLRWQRDEPRQRAAEFEVGDCSDCYKRGGRVPYGD